MTMVANELMNLDEVSVRLKEKGRFVMHPADEAVLAETRRQFFGTRRPRSGRRSRCFRYSRRMPRRRAGDQQATGGLPGLPHFAPKAKRAIYLHMLGAPPQMETFDYKPDMQNWFDNDLPESIRNGQRLTTMTCRADPLSHRSLGLQVRTARQCGAWVSELLPYTAKMVDDIAIIRSMHTDAINHEPAITFLQTGFMIAGKPCIGSWLAYGLGSMNQSTCRPLWC